jgi:two-component system response regulator FixJ
MMQLIYIVDSDSRNLGQTSFMLRARGYDTRVYDGGVEILATPIPTTGCVLLKMDMPGLGGLEVHGRLIARGLMLPVIFLGGDVRLAVRAMQQGAVDVMTLPYEADELVHAIERAFSLAERDHENRRVRADAAARLSALTPRGIQILQGLQAGMINSKIAEWLDLSPRTVEAYRAAMMADIGATSVSHALRIAMDGGLPPIAPEPEFGPPEHLSPGNLAPASRGGVN